MAFRQRVGRLSRDGENSESVLMVGFADYVYAAIKAQLRRFDTITPSDTTPASIGHIVSFLSPTRYVRQGINISNARKAELADTFHDLQHQVLKFVCLKTGFWHCKFEYLCSTGQFPRGIPSNLTEFPPCMTQCPYCDGSYDKQFKPVDYSVLRTWLSGPVTVNFPIRGSLDNPNALIELFLLTKYKYDYYL